jgi:hypothetical protein
MNELDLDPIALHSLLRAAYESDNPRATLWAFLRPYARCSRAVMEALGCRVIAHPSPTHELFAYQATSRSRVWLGSGTPKREPVFYDGTNRPVRAYLWLCPDQFGMIRVISAETRTLGGASVDVEVERHDVAGAMLPLQARLVEGTTKESIAFRVTVYLHLGCACAVMSGGGGASATNASVAILITTPEQDRLLACVLIRAAQVSSMSPIIVPEGVPKKK